MGREGNIREDIGIPTYHFCGAISFEAIYLLYFFTACTIPVYRLYAIKLFHFLGYTYPGIYKCVPVYVYTLWNWSKFGNPVTMLKIES